MVAFNERACVCCFGNSSKKLVCHFHKMDTYEDVYRPGILIYQGGSPLSAIISGVKRVINNSHWRRFKSFPNHNIIFIYTWWERGVIVEHFKYMDCKMNMVLFPLFLFPYCSSYLTEINSIRTNLSPFTKGYRGLVSF